MTPFVSIEPSAATSMQYRLELLQRPADFFRPFFAGRVPSPPEKVMFVEQMVQLTAAAFTWENDTYSVAVRHHPPFVHLCIMRHDGGVCDNWRELQQIKNQIVGPEHEGAELYPAESRLAGTHNQHHLWVHTSTDFRFPFGFAERCVLSNPVRYRRYSYSDKVDQVTERPLESEVA